MHIRQGKAEFQLCRGLVGLEQHIGEATARGFLLQAFFLVAFADDEKHNLQAMTQPLGRGEHDGRLMCAAIWPRPRSALGRVYPPPYRHVRPVTIPLPAR